MRRRVRAGVPLRAARERIAALRAGNEDGFLLVEVMISAVLVALIVTATFNGLDVATRLSSDQRHHNQAELLAAQSQEQLRSESAIALDELVTRTHKFTRTINGVEYTITQEAAIVAGNTKKTGCSSSETTANSAGNFRLTTTVKWPQQEKGKRPPVKQSGVITPPTGSGIEVDVIDGSGGPVSGVTARAKFIPNESGTYNTVEGTTASAGCVLLSGIQSTEATVEIIQVTGFVTYSGALVPKPKSIQIAPNVTTHYVVAYAEAGAIAAKFTYKGSTTWEGTPVKSDTFVVANTGKMETAPEYEVGSTSIVHETTGEENFEALTGTYSNAGTKPEPLTAEAPKYPNGDLFPFSTGWNVYAGDCSANKDSEGEASAVVTSGKTTSVEVPLSYTKLTVWTGSYKTKEGSEIAEGLKVSGGNAVKITNTGCAGAEKPNNSKGFVYTHEQKETLAKGRLEVPFQPFGEASLCLVNSAAKKIYRTPFTNSTVAGSAPVIYLGQRTSTEQTTLKTGYETEETSLKSKISSEEKSRTTWESELSTAKTTKTTYEKEISEAPTKKSQAETEISKWKKKYEKGEISKATYEKEAKKWEEQKAAAESVIKNRPKELETLEKTTIQGLESKITTATSNINGWKTTLSTVQGNKKTLETEITGENANGVTVESGTKC